MNNRLDLIIDALESCNEAAARPFDAEQVQEALVAARELKELEIVAWMWKDGTVTTDPDRADGTWTPLYALDLEVTK